MLFKFIRKNFLISDNSLIVYQFANDLNFGVEAEYIKTLLSTIFKIAFRTL